MSRKKKRNQNKTRVLNLRETVIREMDKRLEKVEHTMETFEECVLGQLNTTKEEIKTIRVNVQEGFDLANRWHAIRD